MGWLNVVCSGKFHYLYYAKYLSRGVLSKVYYSHKISTDGGLELEFRKNLFIKEYLTGLHLKLAGEFQIIGGLRLYNRIWARQLSASFKPARVNLFLLHGNCATAIGQAKRSGGIVVGEAVNAHPEEVKSRLVREASKYQLPAPAAARDNSSLLAEVAMVDYLLCPSTAVAESYVSFGYPSGRIIIIPYGVELPSTVSPMRMASRSAQAEGHLGLNSHEVKLRIVCVGQICIRKGQLRLLELVKKNWGDGNHLMPVITFIGRPDPIYLDEMKKCGVCFEVMPHVPHSELMPLLRTFDLFCLPSIEDGFAMVALEAAACGVPVLISKHAGASEILGGIDGCYVFDPDSHQDFQKGISILGLTKPKLDLAKFSWQQYAMKLEGALRRISGAEL